MPAENLIDFTKNGILRVDYLRDGLLEEFHEGVYEVGVSTVSSSTPYYLRSCAKPLQASLLISYNIDFTQEEIAFCSGSHAGEICHIETAKNILNKLKLDESFLQCGIHPPLSRSMQDKMLLSGEKYSVLHNNCSGKHLGFLAICQKNGWDLKNYYKPEHPLQLEVKKRIFELCEISNDNTYPVTTDGCGVPIVSMPLKNLLLGYKKLAKFYPQIIEAILQNPYIYGGENRLDTEIVQNSKNIIAKVGAEGLCVVYNLERDAGFVVKMNDASMEARKIAVLEIINRLKWANIKYDNLIKTLNGTVVGEITVTKINV